MSERRITMIQADMSWGDFQKKFWKFFPISDESKRIAKLKAEYERLTGRKPEDKIGKAKGIEQPIVKADSGNDGEKGSGFSKGSRKGGDQSKHGSTFPRKGFFGEKSSEV